MIDSFPCLMDLAMRAPGHRIALGRIMMTRALAACFRSVEEAAEACLPFLLRHAAGDWGEVSEEDRDANDMAITQQGAARVMSVWQIETPCGGRPRLWIITEADRSVTTLLLPSDC